MSKINIEVQEGKEPESAPPADQIGKTQPKADDAGAEVGGRAHVSRMLCWRCGGISTIVVSDVSYNYYDCCYCGATNGPF